MKLIIKRASTVAPIQPLPVKIEPVAAKPLPKMILRTAAPTTLTPAPIEKKAVPLDFSKALKYIPHESPLKHLKVYPHPRACTACGHVYGDPCDGKAAPGACGNLEHLSKK